jgi:hypothetical protein
MKNSILLLAVVAVVFSSCYKVIGDGPVVTEMRPVNNFDGISSSIPGNVNFTVEPVFRVEVKAQENVLEVLQTKVVNGVLEIGFRNGVNVKTHKEITVNVSAPTADYLRISGSGNMNVTGELVSSNLGMNVSGSGNVNIEKVTIANELESGISGSGNMKIATGTAKNLDLQVSGSGAIDLAGVQAEKGTTHISGSGNIKLNLSQTLNAHISGSGSVFYLGTPVISTQISGSGRVMPL